METAICLLFRFHYSTSSGVGQWLVSRCSSPWGRSLHIQALREAIVEWSQSLGGRQPGMGKDAKTTVVMSHRYWRSRWFRPRFFQMFRQRKTPSYPVWLAVVWTAPG